MRIFLLLIPLLICGCSEPANVSKVAPENIKVESIEQTPVMKPGDDVANQEAPLPDDVPPSDNTPTDIPTEPAADPVQPPVDEDDSVTLAELADHSAASDCWVAYQGEVFDVTEYLGTHPGGEKTISDHCGTERDFSDAFEGRHALSEVDKLMEMGIFIGLLE